eukprot:XP_001693309.1 predicted protein [Chlamydomonas reinhardtii]
MPTLPSLAAAAAPVGSDTTMAGVAGGGGGASGSNTDRGPSMASHLARLRASHQSLPEDALSQAGTSVSREAPRPSDAAARSRWRSPRTPPNGTADGDASGSVSAANAGVSLEKLSHPGGPLDAAMPAANASLAASTTGNTMPGVSGGATAGASQAGGGTTAGGGAAGAGGAPKTDKDKESRPAVMAECYKITQQPAGGMGGGGNEVAQSITMIKYTNLKQELERAEEGEGDDVPVPTNMLLVPTVAVDVAIWSLGSFRLKGVTEPIKIVQVLPVSLEGRLSILNKAGLNRGKARCIERRVACLEVLTLQLPDVSRLSCVSMASGGGTPGGEEDLGPSGAYGGEGGDGGGYDGGGYGQVDMMGGMEDAFATNATAMATDQFLGTGPGGGQWQPADLIAVDGVPGLGAAGGQHGTLAPPHSYPAAAIQHGIYAGPGGAGTGAGVGMGGGTASISLSLMQHPPSDLSGRWMPPGMRGNNPLRDMDSSEAGLPPISEVVTPVSSPIGQRSRSGVLSQPGGSLALQQAASAPSQQQQQRQQQSRQLPLPPHGTALQQAAAAAAATAVATSGPAAPGFVTMASTSSFDPDTSRPESSPWSISLSYAAHRQQVLAAAAGGAGSYTMSPAGTGPHRHVPSGGLGSAALSGGSDSGGEALRNYQHRQAGRNGASGNGRTSPYGPASMWPQTSPRYQPQPQLGAVGDGTSPGGGAVPHSTGLLPSSLSYMATNNPYGSQAGGDRGIIVGGGGNHTASGDSRDPIGRGYAAMLAAGMAVHSVGGEDPADSVMSHRGSGQGGGSNHTGLLHTNSSGAHGRLPLQHQDYHAATAEAAAADGGYHAMAPPALATERSSTGNVPSSTVSPLLIDRVSSGFYRPYSSGYAPGGPPLTDRSSSGRYPPPSGTATGITPSDRTSSGRYPPGMLPPGISLTTDRSSSGRRNPGSSFGRSEAALDIPVFSPHGSGLPPLPEVASPGAPADYQPDAYPQRHYHRSTSGSSAGGSPGGSDSGRYNRNPSQKGGMPSRLGPTRSFTTAAKTRQDSGPCGGSDGEEADGEGEDMEEQQRWLEDEHSPPGDPSDYRYHDHHQQQHQQAQQLQMPGHGQAAVNSVDSGSGALGGYAGSGYGGSGYGGSGYAGSGMSGVAASDARRVPTFATLVPQGSHASTDLLDISASVRSSMAGSGALGPRVGRVSTNMLAGMTPVDSLRTFGLRHLPEQQQTSASDLLRPFEEGGHESYAPQRG